MVSQWPGSQASAVWHVVCAGIGRLLIQSIGFRDYPIVQGCILFIAVTYVGMNLLTDLVYGVLDPRIRYD